MSDLRLRLAFYDASDGPRIMIVGSQEADFASLKTVLVDLAIGRKQTVSLHEAAFISPLRGTSLVLRTSDAESRASIRCGLVRTSPDAPHFEWTCHPDDWEEAVELLAPVLGASGACHQYLNRGWTNQDAQVVVSRGEYGEELVQRDFALQPRTRRESEP